MHEGDLQFRLHVGLSSGVSRQGSLIAGFTVSQMKWAEHYIVYILAFSLQCEPVTFCKRGLDVNCKQMVLLYKVLLQEKCWNATR